MANELTKKDENVLALVNGDHSIEELIKPLSHEIFLFDSFVAGTTFIKDETVFDELKVGDKLILSGRRIIVLMRTPSLSWMQNKGNSATSRRRIISFSRG
ncbi:MAG: hypothetical protein J6T47_10260 [Lachnospiraceae bacterium]|nr:hypothetical protein [Lachnospiraceae bacterium]